MSPRQPPRGRERSCPSPPRRKDAEWVWTCARVRGSVPAAEAAFPGTALHLVNKSLATPPRRAAGERG